ncbi:tetratricopeptide repeat protein [Bacteroidota bacterium]
MKKHRITYCLFLVLVACSTEKNTIVTRSYHNLTGHYNIFFNGFESYNRGLEKQRESHQDNYSIILPLFIYSNEELALVSQSDMERTSKKSTKLIALHSITVNPKRKNGVLTEKEKEFYNRNEYNKWVDDAYMLIGKAHFQRREFEEAIETFNFVINEFKTQDIRFEALIWLMRTGVETEDYGRAEEVINQLRGNTRLPEALKGEFNVVYAQYLIDMKNYDQAIEKLEEALEMINKKWDKIRYTYVLSQLYEEIGNRDESYEIYKKITKMNPPYEMVFNAKVKMASLLDLETGESKEVKAELLKMLKDEKNKEYLDQIYYALGEIEFKEKNVDQAIQYFRKSSASSINNTTQQVKSFLRLGEIYFNRNDYFNSQTYYDSALTFITRDYPDYEEIFLNTRILTELVSNLNVIFFEDSVQRVATMSEAERDKLIDKLIEKVIEEEKRIAALQAQNKLDRYDMYNNSNFNRNVTQTGKWYFYNPSALSFGQSEFEKIWGKRKLEDNWRRKNKQSTSGATDLAQTEQEDSVKTVVKKSYSRKDKRYYLENLPFTEEKLILSNGRIAEALYNVGIIYYEKLNNNKKAIDRLDELVNRFPDSEYVLPAYYTLYLIYRDEGNLIKENYYKELIIRNYSNSNYAHVLSNPNYRAELEEENRRLENLYEQTFNYYKNKNFEGVQENYLTASLNYTSNPIFNQFRYLNILSIGQTSNLRIFKDSVQQFIEDDPGEELSENAKGLLAKIKEEELAVSKEELKELLEEDEIEQDNSEEKSESVKEEIAYTVNDDEPHKMILVLRKPVDNNQLKFNLTSFLVDHYDIDKYPISTEELNVNYALFHISGILNKEEAIMFYELAKQQESLIMKDIDNQDAYFFMISESNFLLFMKDRSIRDYLIFFNRNYLK